MEPPLRILRRLRELNSSSPCAKSKRGVIIYDQGSGVIRSRGWNAPPLPFLCDGSDACRRDCSKTCVHAEQAAINDATARPLYGHALVHGKFVAGELVAGGGPSCWQCSKLILSVGIETVWLFENVTIASATANFPHDIKEPKWRSYTALEFHTATLAACAIHAGPGPGP